MTMQILTPGAASVATSEDAGFTPVRRAMTPQRMARIAEAWDLFDRATSGSYAAKAQLQETMSTSDFPLMFGAALDAQLLAAYQAAPSVWQTFAARDTVPDFRPHTWLDMLGGQGALSLVGEGSPYPRRAVKEATGGYSVAKYGDTFGLTWELFINDRLNAFRSLPGRLAVAAREMEDRIATAQILAAAGPNSALFSSTAVKGPKGATSTNLVAGNPALSEAAVEGALTTISTRRDYDDRPIILTAAILMVPPALQTTAERIVGATEIRDTTGNRTVVRTNPLAGRLRVVVNPWWSTVDVSANKDTSWAILPEPTNSGRPAAVLGFLAGHETPDLRVKNDQGARVGGGAVPVEEGSFEFDTIDYRVRHILGGGPVDANATAFSNGSGS